MSEQTSQSGQGESTSDGSLIGSVIDGRFEIKRLLGLGAMGEVYLARQLSIDVDRAVKLIGAGHELSEELEKRFRREAFAMSRLQHEKIAQVIDFGSLAEGGHYLVIEYIPGPNLRQVVTERGPFAMDEALWVLFQLAEALSCAHDLGIVHRDLKPANVLLREGDLGRVKVIDFGLAKLVTGETLTKLTADQQILGTPLYMSPEQCACEEVGAPADVYALAGMAYYFLSGQAVFPERTVTAIVYAQTMKQPCALSERCPALGVVPELDALLLACLAKRPGDRPTAAEMQRVLGELYHDMDRGGRVAYHTPLPLPGANVLDSPEALASQIWLDRPAVEAAAGEVGGSTSSNVRDALFNQTTALLLELATALQSHLNLSSTLGRQVSRIQEIQETITNVEMDIALLDSTLDDPLTTVESVGVGDVRTELLDSSTELKRTMNREYRNLYKQVIAYRRETDEPALQAYYEELERIISRYLDLAAQSHGAGTRP
jgi:serine/threonine protein kinase